MKEESLVTRGRRSEGWEEEEIRRIGNESKGKEERRDMALGGKEGRTE